MRMTTTLLRTEDMGSPSGTTATGTAPVSAGGGSSRPETLPLPSPSQGMADVVKMGKLRKFKGKMKWFVVRRESESGPARLEYYAKERYFRDGQQPRRTICLKYCFNINRTDSKVKWAIALHTHNDCLRIVFSSEEEMKEWLQLLNSLAGVEEESTEDTPNKPHFEHVWLVQALNKGLGSKEGILGPYRLCLTSRELTLFKVGDGDERNSLLRFPLNVIRSVSHDSTFGCFFHIEFGRLAVTGPGQLILRTEDNNIAQNMHLLILKAMQNYSKEELIPRRGRTYTWNSGYSDSASRPPSFISQTPPVFARIHSVDSGVSRNRTESMTSTDSRSGASPPLPISLSHQTPPSISFHTPLCSTTDSASSSYSGDYENNNNGESRAGAQEQDSYVPWNPGEDSALRLPLQPGDAGDYMATEPRSGTSSSYMDMQGSPLSPFENYVQMSPGSSLPPEAAGKASVSHSRNSSLVEDVDGYVPMVSGQQSTTPLTNGVGFSSSQLDAYLEMDLSNSRQKMSLNREDRSLPASSAESLQSRTPSSDFPLEKVSSYLLTSDDLDDANARPVRAYSVGSRSDTGATLKSRHGKNRLEAVQETFRIRALSVGSKNPRSSKGIGLFSPPPITPPHSAQGSTSSVNGPQLSSSWSGTSGRWAQLKSQMSPSITSIQSHQNSEHPDSDLMELDFSHNRDKRGRKSSLTGIRESPSSSNCSSGLLAESPDAYMQMNISTASSKYPSSAPITIQKSGEKSSVEHGAAPLMSRMTSLDLNQSHPQSTTAEDASYMPMNFTPVMAKPIENLTPAPFTLTTSSSSIPTSSSSSSLSRIEESPEKQEAQARVGGVRRTQSTIEEEPSQAIAYADVEHPRTGGGRIFSSPLPPPSYPPVMYSQINFMKKSPSTK